MFGFICGYCFRYIAQSKADITLAEKYQRIKDSVPKRSLDAVDAMNMGIDMHPQSFGFINTIFKIEVAHGQNKLISVPFNFMVHDYLKRYNFDPDNMTFDTPYVYLYLFGKEYIKFPLFSKSRVPDRDMTVEELISLGLIVKK